MVLSSSAFRVLDFEWVRLFPDKFSPSRRVVPVLEWIKSWTAFLLREDRLSRSWSPCLQVGTYVMLKSS